MWRRDKFKFPPGPYRGLKGWSFRALRQNPLEMFSELARCGDIVGIRVVNFRNIFVNHPDLIEEVLGKEVRVGANYYFDPTRFNRKKPEAAVPPAK